MALEHKDSVKDQTQSTGSTGAMVIDAVAPTGYRTIAAAHTNGATVRYRRQNASGSEWEVGQAVWNSGTSTLTRNAVYASSNSGSAVTFSAGLQTVITTMTAADADEAMASLPIFGDGSDGSVTISSGTTTLTRDTFYSNLTLSGSGVLNTAGFEVLVSGTLDISAAAAGAIQVTPGNASGVTGGAAVAPSWGYAGSTAGGNGGAIATNGGAATAASAYKLNYFGRGGLGTTFAARGGGIGAAGTQGGAGSNAGPLNTHGIWKRPMLGGTSLPGIASSGSDGIGGGIGGPGGGGGATASTGGLGGGGGGGGGAFRIFAKTIIVSGSTPAGVIRALGGNGANGASAASGNSGGGGGGSGGGGGGVQVYYQNLVGGTVTDAVWTDGGTAGTGGDGFGTGWGGWGGSGGGGGTSACFNLGTGTLSASAPITVPNAPTASSSISGTAGSAPIQSRASLI